MKRILVLVIGLILTACQENMSPESEFTGNEVVYNLQPGSVYNIFGTITFKEKTDGTAFIVVDLKGTEGALQHPVHLHLGDISAPDADVAAFLNPIDGQTGKSETNLIRLADEQPITFNELIDLNACIKIHLAETGPDRDIILAAGNIGSALQFNSGGRYDVSVCKSE
jgi:hypothetical protein